MKTFTLFLSLAVAIVSACSEKSAQKSQPVVQDTIYAKPMPDSIEKPNLNKVFGSWLGTPFKYGGDSRTGIDDVHFINHVYREIGGDTIPLDPQKRAASWDELSYKDIQEGDLLLFKTKGNEVDHIGLYIGDGFFAHTSSSKGVTFSIFDSLNSFHQKAFYSVARMKKRR